MREVTEGAINNEAPEQLSPRDVEAIDKVKIGKPGKVIAARCLQTGDVLVTVNSPVTSSVPFRVQHTRLVRL